MRGGMGKISRWVIGTVACNNSFHWFWFNPFEQNANQWGPRVLETPEEPFYVANFQDTRSCKYENLTRKPTKLLEYKL